MIHTYLIRARTARLAHASIEIRLGRRDPHTTHPTTRYPYPHIAHPHPLMLYYLYMSTPKSIYLFYSVLPTSVVSAHIAIADRLDEALAEAKTQMKDVPVIYIGSFSLETLVQTYYPEKLKVDSVPTPLTLPPETPTPSQELKKDNLDAMALFLKDNGYTVYLRPANTNKKLI